MNYASRIMGKSKKIKYLSFVILCVFYISYFIPMLTSAQPVSGLIPCDGPDCTFNHLLMFFRNIIDYVISFLLIPLATISFALSGWKMMTNADNPGKRAEAKSSMLKVAIGIIVIVGAWFIVKFVLNVFLNEETLNQIPIQ